MLMHRADSWRTFEHQLDLMLHHLPIGGRLTAGLHRVAPFVWVCTGTGSAAVRNQTDNLTATVSASTGHAVCSAVGDYLALEDWVEGRRSTYYYGCVGLADGRLRQLSARVGGGALMTPSRAPRGRRDAEASDGDAACSCDAGFAGTPAWDGLAGRWAHLCSDVDECATDNGGCAANELCVQRAPGDGRNCSCAAGYYRGTDAQRECTPHSTCQAGQQVRVNGGATSDRQCEACPAGRFSTSANTARCQPWSTCGLCGVARPRAPPRLRLFPWRVWWRRTRAEEVGVSAAADLSAGHWAHILRQL